MALNISHREISYSTDEISLCPVVPTSVYFSFYYNNLPKQIFGGGLRCNYLQLFKSSIWHSLA